MRIDLEGVFVQIGLLPNSDWLKGTIALSPRGEIEIDARGETSLPGVFAAGDVTTVPYKQIVIAMGEGSKAALSAFDYLIRSSVPDCACFTRADRALALGLGDQALDRQTICRVRFNDDDPDTTAMICVHKLNNEMSRKRALLIDRLPQRPQFSAHHACCDGRHGRA
jgi:hypothetical protein